MKKSRFNEEQMIKAIRRQENGESPAKICRDLGISNGTFYKWKAKYGGLDVSEAKRLRALEEENRQLKRLVADLSLDNRALRDVNSKKW